MWDWLVHSNPIAGMLIGDLSEEQRARGAEQLDGMLRERAAGTGAAALTSRIHIGMGTCLRDAWSLGARLKPGTKIAEPLWRGSPRATTARCYLQ